MGRFVYGPSSFVGMFLIGLAAVAAAGYLLTVSPFSRQPLKTECRLPRDPVSLDDLTDEWAVYQALIKEEGLSESSILIEDDSLSYESSEDDAPIVQTASAETNAAYREQNRRKYSLSLLFASEGANFITNAEIKRLPEADFWRAFHLFHPLSFGMLALSRVGFNSDHTEAIVSFDFACGSLCGHGSAWKLTKIDGKWQKTGNSAFDVYS